MSVRKVYFVLVNGAEVFRGSYAMCNSVYKALLQTKIILAHDFELLIAFYGGNWKEYYYG